MSSFLPSLPSFSSLLLLLLPHRFLQFGSPLLAILTSDNRVAVFEPTNHPSHPSYSKVAPLPLPPFLPSPLPLPPSIFGSR